MYRDIHREGLRILYSHEGKVTVVPSELGTGAKL